MEYASIILRSKKNRELFENNREIISNKKKNNRSWFCRLHLTAIGVESRHARSFVPQVSATNENIDPSRSHLLRTVFSYQLCYNIIVIHNYYIYICTV